MQPRSAGRSPTRTACCGCRITTAAAVGWASLFYASGNFGPTWGSFSAGSDVWQVPRSGTYTLTVSADTQFTGTYSFKLVSVPVRPPMSIMIGQTVSANLDTPGVEDSFEFDGTAGQQISFTPTGTHSDWAWKLIDAGGFRVGVQHTWSAVSSITLPATGKYRIVVWDDNIWKTIGAYSFKLAIVGTAAVTPPPAPDLVPISIGATVGLNSPKAGAGQIEVAGCNRRVPVRRGLRRCRRLRRHGELR